MEQNTQNKTYSLSLKVTDNIKFILNLKLEVLPGTPVLANASHQPTIDKTKPIKQLFNPVITVDLTKMGAIDGNVTLKTYTKIIFLYRNHPVSLWFQPRLTTMTWKYALEHTKAIAHMLQNLP